MQTQPLSIMQIKSPLELVINGQQVVVDDPEPEMTLLQFLRSRGLTGTKLGCAEGGCGACTVMVGSMEEGKELKYSVNACLAPICSLNKKSVTTVEGIGNCKEPHPIQQAMAEEFGSQCGFCTPGIVMSFYTLESSKGKVSDEDVERSVDGNLCRCTGYRSILKAAKKACMKACEKQGSCSKDMEDFCKDSKELKIFSGERVTWHHLYSKEHVLHYLKATTI